MRQGLRRLLKPGLMKTRFLKCVGSCFSLVLLIYCLAPFYSVVYAQPVNIPVNLKEFLAEDSRLQKKVVELEQLGRYAEAADMLDQIADRDLKMAPNLPASLRNTFLRSAERCRELAKSLRRKAGVGGRIK